MPSAYLVTLDILFPSDMEAWIKRLLTFFKWHFRIHFVLKIVYFEIQIGSSNDFVSNSYNGLLPWYMYAYLHHQASKSQPVCLPFLPEASIGLRVLSLPVSGCLFVHPSVRPSITKFVHVITHHPLKLGSPNEDHRCKRPWLRSLLFLGMIDLDLQGQI